MTTSHNSEALQPNLPDFKIKPEYESLVPKMPEHVYEQLKESIKTDGQWVPITVNQNYIVLDGHNRFKACKELGVAPRFEIRKFESEEDEKLFVIKCNLHRRDLKLFEKIGAVYKMDVIAKNYLKFLDII